MDLSLINVYAHKEKFVSSTPPELRPIPPETEGHPFSPSTYKDASTAATLVWRFAQFLFQFIYGYPPPLHVSGRSPNLPDPNL